MSGTPLPLGPGGATPQEWDALSLNGVPVPGWVVIEGLDRELKKDEKGSKGKSGAEVKYTGSKPASLTIRIRYLTQEQHDAIGANILPLVEPNADDKAKPQALTIQHPATSFRKISAVIVEGVSGPTKGGDGFWELTLKCTESRKIKEATGLIGGGNLKGAKCAQLDALLRDIVKAHAQTIVEISQITQQINSNIAPGFTSTTDLPGQHQIANLEAKRADKQGQLRYLQEQMAQIREQQKAQGCDGTKPSSDPAASQPE